MDLLIYLVVLFASATALVCLSYLWISAWNDARSAPEARGRAPRTWLLSLGWPGALIYWLRASRR